MLAVVLIAGSGGCACTPPTESQEKPSVEEQSTKEEPSTEEESAAPAPTPVAADSPPSPASRSAAPSESAPASESMGDPKSPSDRGNTADAAALEDSPADSSPAEDFPAEDFPAGDPPTGGSAAASARGATGRTGSGPNSATYAAPAAAKRRANELRAEAERLAAAGETREAFFTATRAWEIVREHPRDAGCQACATALYPLVKRLGEVAEESGSERSPLSRKPLLVK
jgi:hypothetical protein